VHVLRSDDVVDVALHLFIEIRIRRIDIGEENSGTKL